MHLKGCGQGSQCFAATYSVVCTKSQCLWHFVFHRPMSLSTIAILNSVKKAVESKSKHRSRSLGVLPFTLNSGSPENPCSHGKPFRVGAILKACSLKILNLLLIPLKLFLSFDIKQVLSIINKKTSILRNRVKFKTYPQ